jgi:RNA-binding protein
MSMTSKRRAELRGDAHPLTSKVHLGKEGLTAALVDALDETLRTHELVKVQLNRMADAKPKDAAAALADAASAEVVQVIGRTVTLYRHNPHLERKPGALPPWKDK